MTRFHYASSKDPNMLYFIQDWIADPFFFLEHDGVVRVFLSATDSASYKEKKVSGVEVVDVGPLAEQAAQQEGTRMGNLALHILETYKVTSEITVPDNFPAALANYLKENSVYYIIQSDFVPERIIKTPEEIEYIRQNSAHSIQAYEYIESVLSEAKIEGNTLMYKGAVLTSEFLKREVAKLLLDFDLLNIEGLIISSGTHASMPHHSGTGPILPNETIIVDIFPQSTKNFYFADMTRTYVKGDPSERVVEMYQAVAAAQQASLAALRPGIATKEVYDVSAHIIKEHGFDVGEVGYTHSLGHGLGVAVHELPNLSARSDATLEVGNVVTIEPGLYYEAHGGVRIEDTVVITEEGYENLTNHHKNWRIL